MLKLIVSLEISDGEPPVLVLGLNLFYTRYYLIFASSAAWLYWPEIYVIDFVCRKGLTFTKKNPYIFTHYGGVLQLEEVRVSQGLSCVSLDLFWCPCLILWVSTVYILSLICWCRLLWWDSLWFDFSVSSFSFYVDGHPTICWGIIALSAPFISHWWKYALLLSTVSSKAQSVTWLLIMLCSMLVLSK